MSEERESECSVTVDFKGCRQPDGTYLYNSAEGMTCPVCDRLLTDHSSAQAHECAQKQHNTDKA
jgi:hypothetical protein